MGEPGVGLVWWPVLDDLCLKSEGLVDIVELEPEAFWAPRPREGGFQSFLSAAVGHLPQPKLLHGVGAPLGGSCDANGEHAATFSRDVADLQPEFVSEHLSFNRFSSEAGEPVFTGFLMPPAQSPAGVELSAANIRRRRAAIGGVPLAIENSANYMPRAPGELSDGEFISKVAEKADCGILLDLHNAFCNAKNGRGSVSDFCDALPTDGIWELHLAGGEMENGFYLDSHSGLVEPELMDMAAELIPRLPSLRAVVLEIMPERVAKIGLASIGRQLSRMRDLLDSRGSRRTNLEKSVEVFGFGKEPSPSATRDLPLTPAAWERLLGGSITEKSQSIVGDHLESWWSSSAASIELYKTLSREGRASAVAAAAPNTTRALLQDIGGPETRRLLKQFWLHAPPSYTSFDEAQAFLAFLLGKETIAPKIRSAIKVDLARLSQL